MTPRAVVVALVVCIAVLACRQAPSTSPAPTASATASKSSSPTAAPATAAPSSTPVASLACGTFPETGRLPSDRLTNVDLDHQPGRDVVRFTFGEASLTPTGAATGTLDVASPPFTEASSGSAIDLHGEHALQIVYKGMSLQNDIGEPTYTGQREIESVGASIVVRHIVLFDESEGQMGWFVGYDGSGCVSLTREGADVLLTIASG